MKMNLEKKNTEIPFELTEERMQLNRKYAIEQQAKENNKKASAFANPVLVMEEDPNRNSRSIRIQHEKEAYIEVGQGSRPRQQDRGDAQWVEELFLLNVPEILKILYDTAIDFGEKYSNCNYGSTANVVIFAHNTLAIMNIGDSRSVLLKENEAIQLSYDHDPTLPTEKQQIEKNGGRVTTCARVAPSKKNADKEDKYGIAMSRSIGNDNFYPGKSHIPSMNYITFSQDENIDNYMLVLASDGLWNAVSSNDLLALKQKNPDCKKLAESARTTAYRCLKTAQMNLMKSNNHRGLDNCIVLTARLIEGAVYAVFDGHGASDEVVDALQQGFINEFRRKANQYLKENGRNPPPLPEGGSTEEEVQLTQPTLSEEGKQNLQNESVSLPEEVKQDNHSSLPSLSPQKKRKTDQTADEYNQTLLNGYNQFSAIGAAPKKRKTSPEQPKGITKNDLQTN